MIGREEGVENQSLDRPRMMTTDTEMITSMDRGVDDDDRSMVTTTEAETTTSNAYGIENDEPLECVDCKKHFKNILGLKIHQGRICRKKTTKRGSSDRKTRSKSSQDPNHRGLVTATPESQNLQCSPLNESSDKKEKILWPTSAEKNKWKEFESTVCKKLKDTKGTTEKLVILASTIYGVGQ